MLWQEYKPAKAKKANSDPGLFCFEYDLALFKFIDAADNEYSTFTRKFITHLPLFSQG